MANSPGGGFAGPGSHKGSFCEDEEGWFEAMLESLGPLMLKPWKTMSLSIFSK